VFINVTVYISTDVCVLRLVVCRSSRILMLRKNIISLGFFWEGYESLMARVSRISAAVRRYTLYVYISKCYNDVRRLFVEFAT
jgi:hypothetical protein